MPTRSSPHGQNAGSGPTTASTRARAGLEHHIPLVSLAAEQHVVAKRTCRSLPNVPGPSRLLRMVAEIRKPHDVLVP
jgi:hypothetical protein